MWEGHKLFPHSTTPQCLPLPPPYCPLPSPPGPPGPSPAHQNAVCLVLVEPGLVLGLRDDETEVKQEHLDLQWSPRGGGVPELQRSLVVKLPMSVEVVL